MVREIACRPPMTWPVNVPLRRSETKVSANIVYCSLLQQSSAKSTLPLHACTRWFHHQDLLTWVQGRFAAPLVEWLSCLSMTA